MELSNSFLRKRVKLNHHPRNITQALASHIKLSKQSPHERKNSNSTVIENTKISNTLNSEILYQKLKPFSYKRAESELRQIFKKSPAHRNSRFSRNSFLKPLLKYPNSKSNGLQSSLISPSSKAEPLKLLKNESKDSSKFDLDGPIRIKRKKIKPKKLKKKDFLFFAYDEPNDFSLDIQKSLKSISNSLTDDWQKSVLYYNIKYNKGSPELFEGYYKSELEELLISVQSNLAGLEEVKLRLFKTIEKLLIQLLGTENDYSTFLNVFSETTREGVSDLIDKCIKLYKFRDKTAWILENIIDRENILKCKISNHKKATRLFGVNNKIKEAISSWLLDECAPFTTFQFKGEDYLKTLNNDIETQLITNATDLKT